MRLGRHAEGCGAPGRGVEVDGVDEAREEAKGRNLHRAVLRVRARANRPPLGAILGAVGLLAGLTISLLHLDRLPVVLCVFKGLTGLPCPTCGSTRALSRIFALDPAGALAMNPLTTVGALFIAAWALADLVLLPRRRALHIEVHPRLVFGLRIGAVLAFLANWVYLLVSGR